MKQALTEALAMLDDPANMRFTIKQIKESRRTVNTAARLVEGLLPEICPLCNGTAKEYTVDDSARPHNVRCSICRGSGRVWDEGIVEAVAKAIGNWESAPYDDGPGNAGTYDDLARAVLSALVELLTEKVEK